MGLINMVSLFFLGGQHDMLSAGFFPDLSRREEVHIIEGPALNGREGTWERSGSLRSGRRGLTCIVRLGSTKTSGHCKENTFPMYEIRFSIYQ